MTGMNLTFNRVTLLHARLVASFTFFVCGFNSYAQHFDSWEKVKREGQGKLSIVYFETPGFFTMENGQAKGLCPELLNNFVAFVKNKYEKNLTLNIVSEEKDFPAFLEK